MSRVDVFGAGAFGSAMAIVLARANHEVTLWCRRGAEEINTTRRTPRLAAHQLPDALRVTGEISDCSSPIALFAVPTQQMARFADHHRLSCEIAVSCAKGIDHSTGLGPARLLDQHMPIAAQLTGPSFADDIAAGLPTALTLACTDSAAARAVQSLFADTPLRLYRSSDVIGAELGGALKNVIALACGACIGEGMGNSARAALMTRGFAEMQRLAAALGADPLTLQGLSGMGDLALTCYSEQSRNFRRGLALGRREEWDENTTVEGVTTTHATLRLAKSHGVDMPITKMMSDLLSGTHSVAEAMQTLLNRPLKEE